MNMRTAGIHHITSIVGHPQENVDFYREVMGFRLVKKTVNFDELETYHLYFGDSEANPGTIITFFPWVEARAGIIGDGQVGVTSYAVPEGSLKFWIDRLNSKGIVFNKTKRFNKELIEFKDPHGLKLELVERADGENNNWEVDGITPNEAIKGFAGVVLYSSNPEET